MLVPNPRGNYHFLPGGPAFSGAVIADPGHAIVHVTLLNPPPVAQGFDFIAAYLKQAGRPTQAVCSIELRSPKQLPPAEFGSFNSQTYRPALEKHDLINDGAVPMTRSNLAVELDPPSAAVMYAFSYTVPAASSSEPRDFVLSGAADMGHDNRIVRAGETSDDAMREKAEYVMGELKGRLDELQVSWDHCTTINIYTVYNLYSYLLPVLLEPVGRAEMQGIKWYYVRGPIQGLELEVDARRVQSDVYLS